MKLLRILPDDEIIGADAVLQPLEVLRILPDDEIIGADAVLQIMPDDEALGAFGVHHPDGRLGAVGR